ncbi:hypothetical protein EDD86DRAFT_202299 [Gorgonomyces haynaldii]|nr:hypothetical protein EDD86DRAFT_202299 [Gorgonomyces haynaldii]
MDFQRQLLAQLMDPLLPTNRKDFRDEDVCKHFLVAFCPQEQFVNTKVDLGRCHKVHDDKLALDYRRSPDRGKLGYEYDFHQFLLVLGEDVDRVIRMGHSKLGTKADLVGLTPQDEVKENIIALEAMAEPKLEALEHFGRLGKLKEAYDLQLALEKIYAELEVVRQDDVTDPSFRADKRMDVCVVCGALLANDANTLRLDAHLGGKQHQGYIKVRDALEAFKVLDLIVEKSTYQAQDDV